MGNAAITIKTGLAPNLISSGWQILLAIAKRKLNYLAAAVELKDLLIPPGNMLERLKGDLKEYYSIRINEQWRIIFKWKDGNVFDVRVTDYH